MGKTLPRYRCSMSSAQGLIRTILINIPFNCLFSDPISVKHGASVSMHKSTAMKVDDSTMLSPRTSSLTKKTRSVSQSIWDQNWPGYCVNLGQINRFWGGGLKSKVEPGQCCNLGYKPKFQWYTRSNT